MARRRFFVPEVRHGVAELTGPDAKHLVRVLRAEPGQVYELSDNQYAYLAEIEAARKSVVSFRIIEKLAPPQASVQVTLITALIKFDHLEWLIEKATELGVSAIQPFEAIRSERGLAQAAVKRLARWRRIALEASQQSRRTVLPHIGEPVRFAKALEANATVHLLLDEGENAAPILRVLPNERTPADHVACLLGPEGGWTDEERDQATKAGWILCGLTRNILRAETAGVAALSIIQAGWL